MEKERGNHEYLFSQLADADNPANFLLKLQPWLQAVFAGLEEENVNQDQEVVGAKDTFVGSGSCGTEERVNRGRGRGIDAGINMLKRWWWRRSWKGAEPEESKS